MPAIPRQKYVSLTQAFTRRWSDVQEQIAAVRLLFAQGPFFSSRLQSQPATSGNKAFALVA
jgi:hypothetical protein